MGNIGFLKDVKLADGARILSNKKLCLATGIFIGTSKEGSDRLEDMNLIYL